MYSFATPDPVTLAVKLTAGLIEITASERDSTTVEVLPWDDSPGAREAAERVRVELVGDRLLIESGLGGARWLLGRSGRLRITVHAPQHSAIDLGVTSADVRCHGRFGDATIGSASGDIYVESVNGDLNAKLTSGDLLVDEVTGQGSTHAASGDLTIGAVAGDLHATTASGDVRVSRCARLGHCAYRLRRHRARLGAPGRGEGEQRLRRRTDRRAAGYRRVAGPQHRLRLHHHRPHLRR